MRYIIESKYRDYTTIYYRYNFDDANKWSNFLRDVYNVDTMIYTEMEYAKSHPDYAHRII